MRRFVAALILLLAALVAAPAAAQTFPVNGGSPVIDQADLLRPEQELDLKSKSEALYAQTGRAFVVATVRSLEGQEIEPYATELFRKWGIGNKERDDGVLLLVAPNERKVRIETGYGAEGFLPDILGGRIIRNDILPRFREDDMAGGIMAGADAIIRQISLPADQARQNVEEAQRQAERSDAGPNFVPVVFWGMIILFVFLSMARRASGRRYLGGVPGSKRRRRGRGFDSGDAAIILWGLSELAEAAGRRGGGGWGGGGGFGGWGGGGGGGGFGGFGGGSSGGGGASGSW
jgi:uncharacterized protein